MKAEVCPTCGTCPTCGKARTQGPWQQPIYPGTAAHPWWQVWYRIIQDSQTTPASLSGSFIY